MHEPSTHSGSPAPVALRAQDQSPPSGEPGRSRPVLDSATPALSWVVPLVRGGQAQRAHQVRVWRAPAAEGAELSRPEDLAPGALLWDSGEVEGGRCVYVPWAGPALAPLDRVLWAVRVRDERGELSGWSRPAVLETGPLAPADWSAHWIEVPARSAARHSFPLSGDVARARLYLTAQGLVRAHVNGVPVNPDSCDPSRTERTTALYRAYDVTDLLRAGENVLTLVAGTGRRMDQEAPPRLLAELVVTGADGATHRVGTGAGWTLGPSPVVAEENFYLEHHDGAFPGGWDTAPGGEAAQVLGTPGAPDEAEGVPQLPRVLPDPGPALRVVREREAVELSRPAPGVRVYDVGENLAGRSVLTLRGVPAGTVIEAVHGELLEADGTVCTTNIRLPFDTERERQVFRYTANGTDGERGGVWFAFHGFRYVEVRGLPQTAEVTVTGRALHTDAPRTGAVSSDEPLVERLVDAAVRTQWNNLHALPEDCPTREQQGWTGDASVSAAAAVAHLDMAGAYRKWLRDLAEGRRPDGAVPGIVPQLEESPQPCDPVWGSAYNVIVREHYLRYGDPEVVREHLVPLREWADHQLGLVGADGLVTEAELSYGFDWLALRQTPPVLLQTAAVIGSLRDLADLERAVGEDALAALRTEQADALVAAARRFLRDPGTGRWAGGTQASAATALMAGLAADAEEEAALLGELATAVRAEGHRVTSGFSATQSVVRALAGGPARPGAAVDRWRAGDGAALLGALRQPEQPGIGAMFTQGPGTLWECWWIDAENTGTGSLDHIGMGAPFAEWVWRRLVGIEPDLAGPGFARFTVAPRPVAGLGRVRGEVETVRGTVVSGWRRVGAGVELSVTVPVGAQALIRVPGGAHGPVRVDGAVLEGSAHPLLTVVGTEGDDLLVRASSGEHVLVSEAPCEERPGPLLGAAPGVPADGSVEVPVLAGDGVRLTVDEGWSAEVAGAGRITVRPPAGAAPGAVARLTATEEGRSNSRALRVESGAGFLSDGVGAKGWTPASPGTTLTVRRSPVCGPVYHEPIPGEVLLVGGEPMDPREPRTARLELPAPLGLPAGGFVYAHVDQCVEAPEGAWMGDVVLRVLAADGSTREARLTRPRPAGWNRVAVDVPEDWAGRHAVVALEVEVVRPASDGTLFPVSFQLARAGWTSAPRTY
ncbi:family 78 glycoside hydrolase catalytic domain [Streptomyces sp. NPDC049954]|uniref:family 78 glycoside hydrolase catalytic domain n=1 Tax=Streptomyces sp. NPDC049954 TaxID=3155779 RepID=UPI0034209BF0